MTCFVFAALKWPSECFHLLKTLFYYICIVLNYPKTRFQARFHEEVRNQMCLAETLHNLLFFSSSNMKFNYHQILLLLLSYMRILLWVHWRQSKVPHLLAWSWLLGMNECLINCNIDYILYGVCTEFNRTSASFWLFFHWDISSNVNIIQDKKVCKNKEREEEGGDEMELNMNALWYCESLIKMFIFIYILHSTVLYSMRSSEYRNAKFKHAITWHDKILL